jgi:hypothetical protein
MSEANVIEEYLVKLRFSADADGFAQFKGVLGDAAEIAASRTEAIVKSLGKWQGTIVGGFAAIGVAAIGIADKIADADLQYQLLATRMYMSTDAAKGLSIATDVLGHSLDEIAWNPELLARFHVLMGDQARMAAIMGPGYEPGLRNIREIRFQFSRFQDELTYGVLPDLISKVFAGLGGGNVLDRLQRINDWIITNLPKITSALASGLVPILKDGKQVLGDFAGMLEDVGVAFTNVVGAFSRDKSIEGTTFNFHNLVVAVDHVSHGLATFVGWITQAERLLAHLASSAALFASGHYKDAAAELSKAYGDFNGGSGAILGGVAGTGIGAGGGALAGGIIGGTLGSVIPVFGTAAGATAGTAIGGAVGAVGGGIFGATEGALSGWWKQKVDPSTAEHGFYTPQTGLSSGNQNPANIHALIDQIANSLGFSPAVAHAVAMIESQEMQFKDGHLQMSGKGPNGGAKGIFQLEDATAAQYGVNSADVTGNIKGGISYLADLSRKYNGNLEEVLAAYNWGEGRLDRAMKRYGYFDTSYLPPETRDYVRRGEAQLSHNGDLNVAIHVHVAKTNASADEIAQATKGAIPDIHSALRPQTRANIAMLGGPIQ